MNQADHYDVLDDPTLNICVCLQSLRHAFLHPHHQQARLLAAALSLATMIRVLHPSRQRMLPPLQQKLKMAVRTSSRARDSQAGAMQGVSMCIPPYVLHKGAWSTCLLGRSRMSNALFLALPVHLLIYTQQAHSFPIGDSHCCLCKTDLILRYSQPMRQCCHVMSMHLPCQCYGYDECRPDNGLQANAIKVLQAFQLLSNMAAPPHPILQQLRKPWHPCIKLNLHGQQGHAELQQLGVIYTSTDFMLWQTCTHPNLAPAEYLQKWHLIMRMC